MDGKSSLAQGSPVEMKAEVVALSDGRLLFHGPIWSELGDDMGPSSYIRQDGLHVVLVTIRE